MQAVVPSLFILAVSPMTLMPLWKTEVSLQVSIIAFTIALKTCMCMQQTNSSSYYFSHCTAVAQGYLRTLRIYRSEKGPCTVTRLLRHTTYISELINVFRALWDIQIMDRFIMLTFFHSCTSICRGLRKHGDCFEIFLLSMQKEWALIVP